MSLEIIKRLVCDECGALSPDAEESESPSELARNEGWSVCGDADHITDRCPACAKKDLHSTMLHVICTDLNKDMEMQPRWHLIFRPGPQSTDQPK